MSSINIMSDKTRGDATCKAHPVWRKTGEENRGDTELRLKQKRFIVYFMQGQWWYIITRYVNMIQRHTDLTTKTTRHRIKDFL